MKINKKPSKKKFVIALIILVIAAAGGYLALAARNHYFPFPAASHDKTYGVGEQAVNMERSEAEKEATRKLEDNPEQKMENEQTDVPKQPATGTSGKATVNVLVTNAGIFNGTVSAGGMVTNLATDQGSCTYTFTNGSSVVTKPSSVLMNATSTTCATVTFPAAELAASGTWQVVLTYDSNAAAGKSAPKEIMK